jgi:hypothetical protein
MWGTQFREKTFKAAKKVRPPAPATGPPLSHVGPNGQPYSANQQASVVATGSSHSLLSPLHPNSPLYPDGLMTPAWIERHRNAVPSAVLGIYELWEKVDPATGSLLDGRRRKDPLGVQMEGSPEREKDAALCSDINEKR